MNKALFNTGERINPEYANNIFQKLNYKKHIFAYSLVEQFVKNKDVAILEVGCGEGYGTAYLSEKGYKITAVDVNQKTIEHAKQKYPAISFKSISKNILPFPDNCFDAIISFQVIEHTDNLPLFLSEIKRVLKEGGVFLCTTPNRKQRLAKSQKPWNKYHIQEFSKKELRKKILPYFPKTIVYGIFGTKKIHKLEYANMYFLRKKKISELLNLYFYSFNLCRILKKIGLRNSDYVSIHNTYLEKNDLMISNKNINKSLDIFIVSKK